MTSNHFTWYGNDMKFCHIYVDPGIVSAEQICGISRNFHEYFVNEIFRKFQTTFENRDSMNEIK